MSDFSDLVEKARDNYLSGQYSDEDLLLVTIATAIQRRVVASQRLRDDPIELIMKQAEELSLDPTLDLVDITTTRLASQGLPAGQVALTSLSDPANDAAPADPHDPPFLLRDLMQLESPHHDPGRFRNGSLRGLAYFADKDVKTIKRACEKGVIPERLCYKTDGGHWKIKWEHVTLADIRAICKAIHKMGRKRVDSEIPDIEYLLRRKRTAQDLELGSGNDHYTDGVSVRREDADASTLKKPISERAIKGVEQKPQLTRLYAACRRLSLDGSTLTGKSIAREMEIPRRTLYNWFSGQELNAVIGRFQTGGAKPTAATVCRDEEREIVAVSPESEEADAFHASIDARLGFSEPPEQNLMPP